MREGDSWLSKKGGGRITSLTSGDGEMEDPIIDEINNILYHPDYIAPEETPRERVIREYNQRFVYMIGVQDID